MRRSTAVLLILFAAFGALYWYMQKPDNAVVKALATSTSSAPLVTDNLVSPEQGPVSKIAVQSADGKKVILENKNGSWLVTADKQGPANPDQADQAGAAAMALRVVTKLAQAPDPAGTGLDHPTFTVLLTLQDGSLNTFQVGKPTVTQSGYYVQTNDGSVVIIDKNQLETLTNLVAEPPFLISTPTPGITPTAKP